MIAPLIKGFLLGIMLSISVGPVIFSIIKQSISSGHKGGFFFIAGVSASDITMVLICNLFSQLFESVMSHEKIIGISGSIFLVIMGLYNIFFKKIVVTDDGKLLPLKSFRRSELIGIFFSGYFMNVLNPGVFLLWIAASSTILADSQQAIHPIQYRIIVFVTCLVVVLLVDSSKVMLAGKIRQKLTPHNIHIINRISGLIFIGFGVALIWGILSNTIPS